MLTAGRFPGGDLPLWDGKPSEGPVHVGLRSASGLSGDSAPQAEDAEHPQVAQGPAGLRLPSRAASSLASAHGSAHEQIVSA